jgi:hypothetical protein
MAFPPTIWPALISARMRISVDRWPEPIIEAASPQKAETTGNEKKSKNNSNRQQKKHGARGIKKRHKPQILEAVQEHQKSPSSALNRAEMARCLAGLGRVTINGVTPTEQHADTAQEQVVVSPAAARIIDRLPRMRISETVNAWRNAIKILADDSKAARHANANELIRIIREEWVRRRTNPLAADDFFEWPSTEADYGIGGLDTQDWEKMGALQFMGYKVGHTEGEPERVRERILGEVFGGPIPPVFPDLYLDEWGNPSSAARLRKMAEAIAAFTRNAKRKRGSRMQAAIKDWERDLEFLYNEYYAGQFGFAWPDSTS